MTTEERKKNRLEKAIENMETAIRKLNHTLEDDFALSFEGKGDKEAGKEKILSKIQNCENKIQQYREKINNL